jgi:DNA-binding GntR family transcriptional regulator
LEQEQSTLTRNAFDSLMAMIRLGDLANGTVINERHIAATLGLSRTPVREALGRLEVQNYLRRSGRALVVVGVSLKDILEIMTVRRGIESEAARMAAGRMSKSKLDDLRTSIHGMASAGEVSGNRHWEIDDSIHLSIAEATGNALIQRLIADLRTRTRMFGKEQIPTRFEPGKGEHLAILDAIEAGDADLASVLMRQHIESARLAILHSAAGDIVQ